MTHELKCSVCGTKCGEITLPDNYNGVLSNQALGVDDVRCDSHLQVPEQPTQ